MRREIARISVLCVCLLALGCDKVGDITNVIEKAHKGDKAKQRVSGMLDGVKKGGTDTTPDVQRAICLWFNGSIFIGDTATLSSASDHFLVFQNEGHIARHIATYEVVDAKEGQHGVFLVSGTIEGQPFTMRVTEGEPIAWVKAP